MTTLIELEANPSINDVKKQVLDYLEKRGNADTCDIIFDLNLDPEMVLAVLNALKAEDKVGCRDVQPKIKQ